MPYQPPKNTQTGRLRLLHLRDQNDAAAETMRAERHRFHAIRQGEPTRAVSSFNLFQTPQSIALAMAHTLAEHLPPSGRWLEPSAGLGRLVDAGMAVGLASPVMVESSTDCAAELYRSNYGGRLLVRDFLQCSVADLGGRFDGVMMNPPFRRGTDIKHTLHALELLKPGGVLVGLCYAGTRQGEHLRPLCDAWEQLPPDSFKTEGTRASVARFVMFA
ncbi:MAG: hypothetical protein AAF593_00225 [Planctomycetota bacterium]